MLDEPKTITQEYLDQLTFKVLGAAIEVHRYFGRGLMESVYHAAMKEELDHREIGFSSELKIPVIYKSRILNIDFKCDFFIEQCLVVELKAVNEALPVHEAQLMTYMNLLKAPKGILINFNVGNIFYEGQKTFVNEHFSSLKKK
jgi:GxxExxY protein